MNSDPATVSVTVNPLPTFSGLAVDEPLAGASITIFAPGADAPLGVAVTDDTGRYSVKPSLGREFYLVTASGGTIAGRTFAGILRAFCTAQSVDACHLSPYSTLLAALTAQYSGSDSERLFKAQQQLASTLGVQGDPFIREALGGVVTDVDLEGLRQLLADGATLDTWVQAVVADIADGYADAEPSKVFLTALARPSKAVAETDFAIDKSIITPVSQPDVPDPEEKLVLPEGTVVQRELYSLQTGEQGASVTSRGYLSDIAYVETQDFSTITGSAEDRVQRIVYQSFNVGAWQGRLDAETTVLSHVFITEPLLMMLPNAEKARVAGLLASTDVFAQAVEEYQKLIGADVTQDRELFEGLVRNLGETGRELLESAQQVSSAQTLLARVQWGSAGVAPMKAKAFRQAGDEPFQVFDGMWFDFDQESQKLKAFSKSSLWYGIQVKDNFSVGGFEWPTTTSLIKPKVGFLTADDFNLARDFRGTVKSEIDPASIAEDLKNSGGQKTVVLFRNNPNSIADMPSVMNLVSVVTVVLETAGAGGRLVEGLKPNKITESINGAFAKAAEFRSKYIGYAKVAAAVLDSVAVLSGLTCETDTGDCKTFFDNARELNKLLETWFGETLKAGEPPALRDSPDPSAEYRSAVKKTLYALTVAGGLGGAQGFTGVTWEYLRPIIISEFIILPVAKAAGVDIEQIEAYDLARGLLNGTPPSKTKFITIWAKAANVKGGAPIRDLASLYNIQRTMIDKLSGLYSFFQDSKNQSATTIVWNIVESSAESANMAVVDSLYNLTKNLTPAKYFDFIISANKLGAIGYDYMTDPSLVRVDVKRSGQDSMEFTHGIPDLKGIRYLKLEPRVSAFKGDNPKLVTAMIPGGYNAIWKSDDGVGWYALGTGKSDNHFLVMSGFRASVENQSAFARSDEGQIKALMDNDKISVLWHVKRFDTSEEIAAVPLSQRIEATAFVNPNTGKPNFVQKNLENTFWWFTDAIKGTDKDNPVQKAVLKEGIDNYKVLDFTEFYRNETGDGSDYPLLHQTPGVYSDYTNIAFSTENGEKVCENSETCFENTLNFYVLPDMAANQTMLQNDAAVYKDFTGNTQNELQLSFDGSDLWRQIAPEGRLWMVLHYPDGENRWSSPVLISGLPADGSAGEDVRAFSLPSAVLGANVEIFLFNDILKTYAERSGKDIFLVLTQARAYGDKNTEKPIIVLNTLGMTPSFQPLLVPKDTDSDGLPDLWDAFPFDDRYQFDSDADGMADEWEDIYGLASHSAEDAAQDKDGEGLNNLEEFTANTDPTKRDTDDDGFSDKVEIGAGTDPLDANSKPENILTVAVVLNNAPSADEEYVFIEDSLKAMGITNIFKVVERDGEGIAYQEIQDADLVILDDVGYYSSPYALEANTVSAVKQFKQAGKPVFFIGDDLACNIHNVPDLADLLHLTACSDNGSSQAVSIKNTAHPIASGQYGTASAFTYSSDLDQTTFAGKSTDEIIAENASGSPVVLAYTDSSKVVVQLPLMHTGEPETKKLFQNAVDWLLQPVQQPAASGKLNDTGITTCSNADENGFICSVSDFPGQDGDFGRDVTHNDDSDGHAGFSYTKIGANGGELPNSATEWYCVKDNVTGLMWELKTDDGGLHDKDWTYTWHEPDASRNGGFEGYRNGGSCDGTSDCDTYAFVQAVNAAGWCGYRDWRMPMVEELLGLVSYDRINPSIDTAVFPNTQSGMHWSGSPDASSSGGAWIVSFDGGSSDGYDRGDGYAVRLVRGGQ